MPRTPRAPLTPEQVEATVSRLTLQQQMTRGWLIETGELAFGPRWQAPMAEALSAAAGRPVSAQSVHNWVIAHRPIPIAMIEPLMAVGHQLTVEARRRADRLKHIWDPDPYVSKLSPEERRQADEDCDFLISLDLAKKQED